MRKHVLVMVAVGMGMVWMSVAAGQEASQPASGPSPDQPAAVTSEPASEPAGEAASQPATTQAATDQETVKATAQKRSADVLKALALTDPAAEAKVRDSLTAFFITRITWGPNDDKVKDLDKQLAKAKKDGDEAKVKELSEQLTALRGELLAMHQALLAELGKVLSAEQIDTVKDALTYGRAKIVYNKIVADHPLTDAQKAAVAKLLADARDVAWMEGSSGDKHKIFDKAVGRVNIYLDALKKLENVQWAIQAGRLDDAEEVLSKVEARDWLKEALGQPLVDVRKALDAAKAAHPSSAPGSRPAGE